MLVQYSMGLLAAEPSDDLASHLDSCSDCQATIMSLEDAEDTLIRRLRTPLGGDSCLAEPEYQAAVARAIAMPAGEATGEKVSGGEGKNASAMPQTLGEYRMLEELGHGGMGRVYKALHTKLDRVVAVKVLPRGRLEDPQSIARFEREMKAVGRLAHPNIVQATDAREIDGMPVLIMEFVDGLDLAEIIRRTGPLPVPEACEVVRQAALGLQRAHEHGLVHRDVKPSNIMLAVGQAGSLPHEAVVKLLDLGLARFYAESGTGASPVSDEDMTGTGQAMGTVDYMAPEQACDSRTVDIRADIYSLGCTLYKLLSGRAPFSGHEYRSTLDKMNAHVHQPVPPIRQFAPEVPEELAAILDRMLAKDPGNRFATPAEVAETVEPFCAGADLGGLLARASATVRQSPKTAGREGESSENALALREMAGIGTAARMRRRSTFKTILIALGFFGALAGAFAAGIIITIKRNGRTYQIEVPENSRTLVDQEGNATVEVPGDAGGKTAPVATPETDLKALEGSWKVVRVEKGNTSDESWRGILGPEPGSNALANPETIDRLRFDEVEFRLFDKRTGYQSSRVYHYQWRLDYRVDPTAVPKTIDLSKHPTPGVSTLRAVGIYEIAGDQLKICLARCFPSLKSEQRPKSFAIDPNSGNILFVLRRDRVFQPKTEDGVARPERSDGRDKSPEASGAARNAEQAKAIAEIGKLGGSVTLDETSPDKPAKKVCLAGWFVTDAALVPLKALPGLESLTLANAQVTDAGMENLKGLTNLRSLDLTFTKVTDAGLSRLEGLTKLQSLNLHGIPITDAGLDHLKALTNLHELSLYNTAITDAGLEHLQGFAELESLDLGANKITGAGFKHLERLTQLKSLNLIWTGMTDAGLERLVGTVEGDRRTAEAEIVMLEGNIATTAAQVESIQRKLLLNRQLPPAERTRLEGDLLVQMTKLDSFRRQRAIHTARQKGAANLRTLNLCATRVTDAGLAHLIVLRNLRSLDLSRTKVTDAGLKHLKALAKLQSLGLKETKVTDVGIQDLRRALPSCHIEPTGPP